MEPSDANPAAPFNWTDEDDDREAQQADECAQAWQDSRDD